MRRVIATTLAGVIVVGAAVLLFGQGSSSYNLRLPVPDASGLIQGSEVVMGGVPVGTASLTVGRGDQVFVNVHIDPKDGPVGRNVTASIATVDLLGQKWVSITKGNTHDPAPSGYTVPASHVTIGTDLDQVVNVLAPDTRARLATMIDQAGAALNGRRQDIGAILGQLPGSLHDATILLQDIEGQSHSLADLVQSGSAFVTTMASQRRQLADLVSAAGQTSQTVAARTAQLREALKQAPSTLVTLQQFLGKLREATVPLGPAANDLIATAPRLVATLDELPSLVSSARPALQAATGVAPSLTMLAQRATPVLAHAVPVAHALQQTVTDAVPVTGILSHSVDNILGIVDNWSRAIEFRDGLSHVFRAEVAVSPDTVNSLLSRYASSVAKIPARHPSAARSAPSPGSTPTSQQPASTTTSPTAPTTSGLPSVLSRLLGGVTSALHHTGTTGASGSSGSGAVSRLLGYLLGP
jgi:phospholipid/cholesterol/gamma-HCH transport system substrate-binding protein